MEAEPATTGKDMLKVDREVLIERVGSCIVIRPAETVYLQVPQETVEVMMDRYGIDLRRDRRRLLVHCALVEETVEGGAAEAAFHYRITKLKGEI